MNTKKAIELIKLVKSDISQGYVTGPISDLDKVIDLLTTEEEPECEAVNCGLQHVKPVDRLTELRDRIDRELNSMHPTKGIGETLIELIEILQEQNHDH